MKWGSWSSHAPNKLAPSAGWCSNALTAFPFVRAVVQCCGVLVVAPRLLSLFLLSASLFQDQRTKGKPSSAVNQSHEIDNMRTKPTTQPSPPTNQAGRVGGKAGDGGSGQQEVRPLHLSDRERDSSSSTRGCRPSSSIAMLQPATVLRMDRSLLARATSSDDKPTPGYMYGEIAK